MGTSFLSAAPGERLRQLEAYPNRSPEADLGPGTAVAGKLDALPQRSPALAGVGTGRPDCDAMTAVMDLADRYHAGWLAAHPFAASQYGLPGHDAEVPDESEEGHARRRSQVEQSLSEARALLAGGLEGDDELTAGCVVASAEGELDGLDSALVEMTVTSMPFQGPA
ncbi:MAG: hypothetical protein M0T80_03605, partial [Actinomycetota bacterium]|nr:hypothetical protein [Actinomycetota bacterium]